VAAGLLGCWASWLLVDHIRSTVMLSGCWCWCWCWCLGAVDAKFGLHSGRGMKFRGATSLIDPEEATSLSPQVGEVRPPPLPGGQIKPDPLGATSPFDSRSTTAFIGS
jgi:hypothetical protein